MIFILSTYILYLFFHLELDKDFVVFLEENAIHKNKLDSTTLVYDY